MKRLTKILHGWIPKEPYLRRSRQRSNGKSSTTAYIVGYGLGIGISGIYTVLIDELGWGTIESSLSPALSFLLGLFVLFPGVLLGMAIGAKLSKKLKERWVK